MAMQRTHQGILHRLAALLRRPAPVRQARLYCVGAPRTGTHSIAALFDRSIRSRHEPGFRSTTRAVLAHHRGLISSDDLRAFVRSRDERLRLDVDSSHVNVFLTDAILAEFEDARFILTIRDCFSWIDSAINHSMNSRHWWAADREYLEFYFDAKDIEYSRHDEFLRQRGLLSIDCYLAAWSRHNNRALASVPADRLLVVRTDEISESRQRIAEFAGVGVERLDPGFRARGRATARHGILGQVDSAYLADRAAEHCGTLMSRFFPDVRSLGDAANDAPPRD